MTQTMQTSAGRTDVRGDVNNNLLVALGSLLSGEEQSNGRLRIESLPVDADSVLEILQNAAVAVAVGSAANMKGYHSLVLHVSIATTATVTFEATIDDVTWFSVGLKTAADGVAVTTTTASGAFKIPADMGAISQFRANITAWTSGAVTCKTRKHFR